MSFIRGCKPKTQPKSEPIPKIISDVVQFLERKGHECPMIIGMSDHQLKWCMKDECDAVKTRKWMTEEQTKQELLMKTLKDEGHTCVEICESFPIQVCWCHETPCKNLQTADMEQRQEQEEKFAERLKSEGHTCVSIGEKYPIRVFWCEETHCKGK